MSGQAHAPFRFGDTSAKGCCAGCADTPAGAITPCMQGKTEQDAMVAGVVDELKTAKWFIDNRWPIIGVSFALGGIAFMTAAYFINRDP